MENGIPSQHRLLRIIAAVLFFLLFFSGTACAEPPGGDPVSNETSVLTNTSVTGTPVVPEALPPILTIDRVEVNNVTCTVYGSVTPGSVNATITMLLWNWGDNSTPEEHLFPNSHDYHNPGTYSLTVTAAQSDGQYHSTSVVIDISLQVIPGIQNVTSPGPLSMLPAGPGIAPSAPTLTLLEPVVNRMNVTLNGNLDSGGSGVNISSVMVDWDDGFSSGYPDLPATHHYSAGGVYTINITAIQSDGKSTSKRISVELQSENSIPRGPVMENPPPADSPVFPIILVTAIVVVILAVVVQRIFSRMSQSANLPDIPRTLSVQEDFYHRAKENGDLVTAAASAHVCAQMCRTFAEKNPARRKTYLEMAEKWEKIAGSAGKAAEQERSGKRTPGDSHKVPSGEDLERLCEGTDVEPAVLDAVVSVAGEIAREGREGLAVGTSFVIGDTEAVMRHSRQFILNPFHGHDEKSRNITNAGIRGNIKEFAQLDGAFIVTGKGIVEAAGRNLTADMSRVKIPEGLGSRHSSIAAITIVSESIGVVVSQSGGQITLFRNGTIVYTIYP